MAKRKISNLDLKIKLTNEYLNNGGTEKIPDVRLLKDLLEVRTGLDGKVDPDTVSTLVNAFMLALLGSHLSPPFFHPEHVSEYQSTLQKSNSFVQENIDTEEQFDKVYEEYKAKDDTLFRGQREAKWRLYSKLQRFWLSEKLFEKEEYHEFIEKLVEKGREEYSDQIKKLLKAKHIDTENSISVLGFLQHHGCPTPLLDWTYKFQNALYFAIDGITLPTTTIEIEDYCSIYFIEEKYFEGGNIRSIISNGLDELEEPELQRLIEIFSYGDEERKKAMQKHFAERKVFDRNRINGSGLISHMTKIQHLINFPIAYFSDRDKDTGIIFSINNSKNILNQVGVFTWNSDSSKPIELVGDELYKEGKSEEETKDYSFCSCFNINKKLKEYIRKRLESDGITKEFIYPIPDVSTWDIYKKCKLKDVKKEEKFDNELDIVILKNILNERFEYDRYHGHVSYSDLIIELNDFNIKTPKELTELLDETEDMILQKEKITIEQIKNRIEHIEEIDDNYRIMTKYIDKGVIFNQAGFVRSAMEVKFGEKYDNYRKMKFEKRRK